MSGVGSAECEVCRNGTVPFEKKQCAPSCLFTGATHAYNLTGLYSVVYAFLTTPLPNPNSNSKPKSEPESCITKP